ncbi:MAG: chemotaxis-specific protein-glutamate methyltransferase CheB [Candidatus Anammoxibacter sp.]
MTPIKLLVVDDSDFCRQIFIDILSSDDQIKIVGEAKNGREAVDMIGRLSPDVVTMDIVMPVMNGLDAIKEIMSTKPLPILVVSEVDDADMAFNALNEGALEVISKSEVDDDDSEFAKKIKLLSGVKVIKRMAAKIVDYRPSAIKPQVVKTGDKFSRIVAIASSTGGPKALAAILPAFDKDFPFPVVVAQHISDGFVTGLVDWLNSVAQLPVKEGQDKETVAAGTVYISPTEKHMTVDHDGMITMIDRRAKDIYHPSCDVLLSSIADISNVGNIGVILTGMGNDGVAGIKAIKDSGGITIAQDEGSSVVFGMPKVAIENGSIDKVLPLDEIGAEIVRLANKK